MFESKTQYIHNILTTMMIIVTYHGNKIEIPLHDELMTSYDIKIAICEYMNCHNDKQSKLNDNNNNQNDSMDVDMTTTSTTALNEESSVQLLLQPNEIKLLWKGKVVHDDTTNLYQYLRLGNNQQKQQETKSNQIYRIMAIGLSNNERQKQEQDRIIFNKQTNIIVRDDLSSNGQKDSRKREKLGQRMLHNAATKRNGIVYSTNEQYGFNKIEVLPNLANEQEAYNILQQLANEPGIIACMKKHKWNVGTLCELYPDGKVGESEVCIMGLNENHGQRILLRIRTDDLRGFRKYLSIKQVLYHELAHNVHSGHGPEFFQLMRQIEKECTQYDWTNGNGITQQQQQQNIDNDYDYIAGLYRLGGNDTKQQDIQDNINNPHRHQHYRRELAANAAEHRMMSIYKMNEIEQNCGCLLSQDLFLPPPQQTQVDITTQPSSNNISNETISNASSSASSSSQQIKEGKNQQK